MPTRARAHLRQLACTLAFTALGLTTTQAQAPGQPAPASPDTQTTTPAQTSTGNTPGQFDYFLLDMPWGPAFCSSIKDVSATCRAQSGFVVHGLWPQNNNGTWPQFCAQSPAPADLATHLSITPDLALLRHEWDKHGTCSGLSAPDFFAATHATFAQITTPLPLIHLNDSRTYTPLMALNLFYIANPGFPSGSFNLSCKEGHVTAIEACFTKSLQPIQCQGLRSCDTQTVTFDPVPVVFAATP